MEILINNENLKTDKVAVLLHFTMGIQSGKSLENEKINLTLVLSHRSFPKTPQTALQNWS